MRMLHWQRTEVVTTAVVHHRVTTGTSKNHCSRGAAIAACKESVDIGIGRVLGSRRQGQPVGASCD